ncbi:MAG TPA: hypothetical protein VIW69_10325 [Candidatus Elarobacter sp.]
MHAFFRALALGGAVSLTSAAGALAAQVDLKPGAASLSFTTVPLANGQNVYCRKAGGEQLQVYVLDREGKRVPAPPGSYKQKNGHVFVVANRGFVRPGSTVMLNPQPLPP